MITKIKGTLAYDIGVGVVDITKDMLTFMNDLLGFIKREIRVGTKAFISDFVGIFVVAKTMATKVIGSRTRDYKHLMQDILSFLLMVILGVIYIGGGFWYGYNIYCCYDYPIYGGAALSKIILIDALPFINMYILLLMFPGLFFIDDIDNKIESFAIILSGPVGMARCVCMFIWLSIMVKNPFRAFRLSTIKPDNWPTDNNCTTVIKNFRTNDMVPLSKSVKNVLLYKVF